MVFNATFSSLSLRGISQFSPIFSSSKMINKRHTTLSHVTASRLFSPFDFHSHSIASLSVSKSLFSKTLSGVIVVESICTEGHYNTTGLVFSSVTSICVVDSRFTECGSRSRSGGGILVKSVDAAVIISRCCFDSCWSTTGSVLGQRSNAGGGGFAVFSNSLTAVSNTFIKCFTSLTRAPAFYAGVTTNCYVNHTLTTQSHGGSITGCTSIFDRGSLYVSHHNSSFNTLLDTGAIASTGVAPYPQLAIFQFGTYDSCVSPRLFAINSIQTGTTVSFCTFTNNNAKSSPIIVRVNGHLHAHNCFFSSNSDYSTTFSSGVTLSHIFGTEPILLDGVDIGPAQGTFLPFTVIVVDKCIKATAAFSPTIKKHSLSTFILSISTVLSSY